MNWKIFYQKNQDAQSARNSISLHAKGDWIIFKDDDDISLPDELERLTRIAQKTQSDIVVTNIGVATKNKYEIEHLYLWYGDLILTSMLGNNHIGGVNALIKMELFKKIGGVYPQYRIGFGDFIILIKALNNQAKITSSIEPTYIYNFIGQGHKNQDESQTETHNHIVASYAFSKLMPPHLRHTPLLIHALNNQALDVKRKSKPSYWIRYIKKLIADFFDSVF